MEGKKHVFESLNNRLNRLINHLELGVKTLRVLVTNDPVDRQILYEKKKPN